VLRSVKEDVFADLSAVEEACTGCGASGDDYLNAFALALTARAGESELETLPVGVKEDPTRLSMEIIYHPSFE
jgi:hypothetical protein